MLFQTGDSSHEAEISPRYRFPLHWSKPSVDSREISEGVVLDYDADGNLTGIDIDNASRKIDLKEVVLSKMPADLQTLVA